MSGENENPKTEDLPEARHGQEPPVGLPVEAAVDLEDRAKPPLAKTEDLSDTTPEDVLLSRLESLVFVSKEPITVRRLARILSLRGKRVRELLDALREHYADRGIILEEVSGGFQFRTHPKNAVVVREAFKLKPLKLSRPSMETLAIVAYRQPITRVEVEQIRGVDCGGVLKYLFEKSLVRVLGRKEEPGRPIIYGTGPAFLELFGLKTLSDLPALHEFSELWDEHQELVDQQAPAEEPDDPEELDPVESPDAAVDSDADGTDEPDAGEEPGDDLLDEVAENGDEQGEGELQ